MNRSALLLSGGMDSIALAWGYRPELAITIDYGQRAANGEIRAAAAVCEEISIPHRILHINCSAIGSGDMAGIGAASNAPVSEWWPYRNQLLITFAAALVVDLSLDSILFGTVCSDVSHADGRSEFFEHINRLLLQQEGGVSVDVPGINHSTVSLCQTFGVPYELLSYSHSCHVAEYACGTCRGCTKHRVSMRELGYGEF
jgi:7-cyano-7-deazaguanine synthase